MSDEERTEIRDQFLKRECDKPDDDEVRIEFIDWLEEHEDPFGNYLRLRSQKSDNRETSHIEWAKFFPGLKNEQNWMLDRGLPVTFHPVGLFHATEEPRYLRFSRDGRLVEFLLPRVREEQDQLRVKTVESSATPRSIDYLFRHVFRYLSYGSYRITPQSQGIGIEFDSHSSAGHIKYVGRIDGDRIDVTWRSDINKLTGSESFEFIPFKDPRLADEIPAKFIKEMMDDLNGSTELEF